MKNQKKFTETQKVKYAKKRLSETMSKNIDVTGRHNAHEKGGTDRFIGSV